MIDFVFPDKKLFPISKPEDITVAIEAFHIFQEDISYETFVYKLVRLAEKRGKDYVDHLPNKLKKLAGFRKENRPEKPLKTSHKKPQSRFKEKRYEDND